ncbi:MAG: hypothetical protein NXI23_17640 [Bacteroidetes bacterium]|nr:hypothetical protein [Bacteroidota bacterium]MDF1863679.1 hypothetical protein [Saprospiraceae bacterium]
MKRITLKNTAVYTPYLNIWNQVVLLIVISEDEVERLYYKSRHCK